MKLTILVADDEKNIREGLREALALDGYEVATAADGKEALEAVTRGDVDLLITDLKMPRLSGEELLKKVTAQFPTMPVIILTGHGTIESAVQAMHDGAYDFLTKPVNLDRLSLLVKRALASRELALQNRAMQEELERRSGFASIIGRSAEMKQVFEMVRQVAPSRSSVLITGESGSGKEMIAEALHYNSPRKDKPFIKLHCAALTESLLESELFGHEKGAFTGAIARKRGRFELAHLGTLFLDEIGEINQNVQIKLLRVLEEKKFERVGGEETVEVDVRLIAATNRDLKDAIAKGSFREDLYYRLNVVNIHIPPLRERKEDIPLLVAAFLKEFSQENGKRIDGIDPKARLALLQLLVAGQRAAASQLHRKRRGAHQGDDDHPRRPAPEHPRRVGNGFAAPARGGKPRRHGKGSDSLHPCARRREQEPNCRNSRYRPQDAPPKDRGVRVMKKSILTRLIGGYILLLVTIALLAVCFAFGVRVDRTAADDARRLTAILERVRVVTLRASLMSTDATPDLLQRHAREMHSADTELLRLAAERPSTIEGALIYPPGLRDTLTVTLAVLGSSWQVELQHLLDAGDNAFYGPDERGHLVALVPAFIDDGENVAMQLSTAVEGVYEARRNLTSSVLALFALFLCIGTVSALAYSLWTLFVLRHDVRNLIAFSRRVSEGDISSLPEVKRSDEIGELAAQLRRTISLQTLVTALRTSGERLAAEYAKFADQIVRTVSGVKSQVKAAGGGRHGDSRGSRSR